VEAVVASGEVNTGKKRVITSRNFQKEGRKEDRDRPRGYRAGPRNPLTQSTRGKKAGKQKGQEDWLQGF